MPEHVGDYWPTCPPEWAKAASIKTARRMLEEYGAVVAVKKAKKFRLAYRPDTWGRKSWDLIIKILESKL